VLRVGETVGPYEILARLKAGGMATLFVGKKRGAAGFSRHVAIKVVHEHLATDEEFVRMFVDEALLQARIHHPNVVHVEELGETAAPERGAPPVHYLVMEYVYGCSLAQLMDTLARRDRRMSAELAVHVAIQTLAGLHAAHELKDEKGAPLGVVHRDVSPQNVLLAYEGHVKLIDFGVAKARNRSQQTTGASIKGKIRYMPPEQAIGAPIDRRADVYALGIVLWEMLAFRKLFSAKDDIVLLDLVRNPRVVPPSQYAKDVPPAVDAVMMKALAPRPEDRYATAQDFRRALAEAMPKAMLVDASHVADLLVAVMSEQMQKDREALPSQLSAVVANDVRRAETVQADEALQTMTISAVGAQYLAEPSPIAQTTPTPAPAFVTAPTVIAAASQTHRPVEPGAPAEIAPSEALGTPPPATSPRSRAPIAVAAIAIVALGLVAGAWYLAQQQSAAEPVARSLATEVPAAAPAPTTTPSVAVTPPESAAAPPTTLVAAPPPPTRAEPPVTTVAPPPPTTTTAARPPPSSATAADSHARTGRRRPPSTRTSSGAVPLADEW
jgi:serine/threonine-protein kinase